MRGISRLKSFLKSIAVILCVWPALSPSAWAAETADAIQPGSIWRDDDKTLTILERKGDTYRARFETGSKIVREVGGPVKGNTISWLAKDVHAISGNQGGDNFGTINGDKIAFVYGKDGKTEGSFTLTRAHEGSTVSPNKPVAGKISGRVYYLGVALNQTGAAGGWVQVGQQGAWKDTTAGTILDGKLYTTETSGNLFVTDLASGNWQQIGKPDFAATQFMFSGGANLYTIETNGNLFRVDPASGGWSQLGVGGGWANTLAVAVLNDRLFSAETSGGLFCTDLSNGTWQKIGGDDFGATKFMFSDRNSLFTIETDGTLYRISPVDGKWSGVGQRGAWKGAIGACVLGGHLYTAEKNGKLFSTDLHSGNRRSVGNADFAATRFMFPTGGNIHTIETDGNLFRVVARASEAVDEFDCFPNAFERAFRDGGAGLSAGFESRKITGDHATHAAILDGFGWLHREAKPDDLAVVYLTAHGGTDPKTGWNIGTADLKLLHASEIKAQLGQVRCPVVFILETCGCGGFAYAHTDDPPVPANVTVLCACGPNESTNNPLDIAVLEGLYGRADFNGDGVIDLDELIQYVERRYKEWWPTHNQASNEPVIARGARVPGSLALTHDSRSLIAVAIGDDFWSALDEGAQGDQLKIRVLGWPGDPGKAYFIANTAPREHTCLPGDGRPVQVLNNGHWRAARLLHVDGAKVSVHYIDEHPGDQTVPANRVRYPFVGRAP